jgi:alkanesulfonate monooxygenase SsuD/methylene tetrahydromethanopterin reductase-like flavin-dependent oxidoreductase (luciferase family)
MRYGAHLPLIDFGDGHPALADLRAYASRAAALGYEALSANDHLVYPRPWLDGPTALAATIADSADMTIATTVCNPVVRGPVQTAKMLAALHALSGGRMIAGVGPGSSPRDYEAVGLDFDNRWPLFEAAVRDLRAQLPDGPPIWIGSWGSAAGLRRVARLGDGWLASVYNTTPERFRESLTGLPAGLPNALATGWMFVSEKRSEVDRVLEEVLAPMLDRPAGALRELALPIGSAEQCAERMSAWADAGVQRLFVWPLRDNLSQLERFAESVVPLVPTSSSGQ